MNQVNVALVETLTAEVRVLMVGSRQITQSVFWQLDAVRIEDITPFGRVRVKLPSRHYLGYDQWVVGEYDSCLVRSGHWSLDKYKEPLYEIVKGMYSLPLIILAGMR